MSGSSSRQLYLSGSGLRQWGSSSGSTSGQLFFKKKKGSILVLHSAETFFFKKNEIKEVVHWCNLLATEKSCNTCKKKLLIEENFFKPNGFC